MRETAVVSFVASPFTEANRTDDAAELLLPVVTAAIEQSGIDRRQIAFTASGSHDFFEGRAFAYIQTLDALGAWPPIQESHVEMDAAWALYEAFVWLQLGEGDAALVYGMGRGSLGSLEEVLPHQLDPYYLTPLRPHPHALAALAARAMLDAGKVTEREMAETAARCRGGDVEDLLAQPYVAAPLRAHDCAPIGDGAAALVVAAGPLARAVCERPAWIRGIDHRMETHYPGARDLTAAPSAARAAQRAGVGADRVDVAELHTRYTHEESLLRGALGLGGDVVVNPSGGPLAGDPVTATGLIRIGEAARCILDASADRAVAHASSGPCLQQNLVCLLEGD